MLRSLYAYKGSHARTLEFTVNETFLEIGSSSDTNWVHVISGRGCLGFVPKNYVAIDQVPPNQMVDMIDVCIEALHLTCSERRSNFNPNEREALQVLVAMRQEWHSKIPPTSHSSKRPAPHPPNVNIDNGMENISLKSPGQPPPEFPSPRSKTGLKDSVAEVSASSLAIENSVVSDEGNNDHTHNGRISKEKMTNDGSSSLRREQNNLIQVSNLRSTIPDGYCREIVEDIRANTNISYSDSLEVVSLVLKSLSITFPTLKPLLQEILNENHTCDVIHDCNWEESADGRNLVQLLEKLRQCKDDDQQRSWALHEDQQMLTSLLNNVIDIITNGNIEVCKKVLALDDHRALLTLVQYYQMETRWLLRKLLLQVLAAVCQLSAGNISFLSSSILPLELTRVILHSKTTEEELQYTSLVLGMVLSMADTLPFPHFNLMNETFIDELLEGIESYNEYPETEGLAELYFTLLLAFNLQNHNSSSSLKKSDSENLVITILSKRKRTKYFIEKLLLLFNREEDPVAMFDHVPSPPHSVMCMMTDIFACSETAQLLYTNDEKVVCDIILRQITDLAHDDQRRHDYLRLMEGVFIRGRWREHKHRKTEFSSRLAAIASSSDASPTDISVIETIIKVIPELKKGS